MVLCVTKMSSPQIDLPLADVARVTEQLHNAFGFSPQDAIQVAMYVPDVVHSICSHVVKTPGM